MVSPGPAKNLGSVSWQSGWLNRVFTRIETFAFNHSLSVLLVSILVAFLCVWVTIEKLQFNTDRGDLVSKDLPFNHLYEQYRADFEDFEGMTVVIEGDNPDHMKEFAEALVAKLRRHRSHFSKIFYKIDTGYFKDKGLLYLDYPELVELSEKIKAHHSFLEKINLSPGLNQLMESINAEISSGMVDTLLGDFLGAPKKESEGKDDTSDLKLLVSILQQIQLHLKGDAVYRSPWKTFLSHREGSLVEEGYLVSDDERLMFILLNPRETRDDFTGSKHSIEAIRKLIREIQVDFPDVQVGLTGGEVISSDEMAVTLDDVSKASQIALIGVALLFIISYKGVVKPLLAVFSLLLALCWSLGFTTLTVGHLNILSVVFFTILIGLGIDFGIHILERYREERCAGKDIALALKKTIQGTGRGNFAGAITTAIAFGAMTLTDFIGIAELGWIAGGGILLCFIAMILLLPALVNLQEKWLKTPYPEHCPVEGEKSRGMYFDNYRWVIPVCAGFLIWAGFSLKDLKFDYNLLNMQAHGTEAVQYELKILDNAKRSTWYAVSLADSLESAIQKHKIIAGIPTVGKVESIVSAMPEEQEKKIEFIQTLSPAIDDLKVVPENENFSLPRLTQTLKNILFKLQGRASSKNNGNEEISSKSDPVAQAHGLTHQLLEDLQSTDPKLAEERLHGFSDRLFVDYREKIDNLKLNAHPEPVTIEELSPDLKKRFIGKSGKYLIAVFPKINIWERKAMEKFLSDLREIDPYVTGNAVHMFESTRLMKEGYIKGGLYAMSAILLYVYFSFGYLRSTFLILLPTLVGSVWTVGIMDLLDVQFNLANLVILPLILGIGVVNGIHITHRYREEKDKETCVLTRSTGKGVVLSSLTTMIGFGSLMIANHRGVFSLGLVLTLGVGCCLLASVTLLPALLRFCTIKGWKI